MNHPSAITDNQARVLHEALLDLMLEAEATGVLLCDRGGNVLTHAAWNERVQVDTIAALASGSFSATQALASLAGEPHFQSVSHEGESASIYILNLAGEFLLVVQFNRATTLGLVKLYSEKAAEKIGTVLALIAQQDASQTEQSESLAFKEDQAPVFPAIQNDSA